MMTTITKDDHLFLNKLRKSDYQLENLPDEIGIPAISDKVEQESKPIILSTIDDLAFAQQGLTQKLADIVKQMEAVSQLVNNARTLGAKGSDFALKYLEENTAVKV